MDNQILKSRFRSLISIIWRKKPDIATRLPSKVVHSTLQFLSIPDQICYALTCKSLYTHYISFLETHDRQRLFPLLHTDERLLYRKINLENANILQVQHLLIPRLETSRWRHCDECWKLHRPSAWRPRLFSWQKDHSCMPFAGKVDLCPCMTITFLNALHLLTATKYTPFKHECTFRDHRLADVDIITEVGLSATHEELLVKNKYTFRLLLQNCSPKVLSFLGIRASLLTSRKNIESWLQSFFDEAKSSFMGWGMPCKVDASLLHCDFKEEKKTDGRLRNLEIIVVRNLGSGKWTDTKWKANRCRRWKRQQIPTVPIVQDLSRDTNESCDNSSASILSIWNLIEEERMAWSCL
ncbi:hypothetical protein BGW36DRAFT_429030 [Talaromyces proteolyticus]|uniref:F-box domain-containing protein n=1 Tax=Talaromyces proteolyticus TaxID=1131652 RepID=A0AAD4PYW8_9EURO|nr:uncharacterized protein BGW36DRAFT_429030 [Talaromyces proteolyticus]KAH8695142.1 hypothetical protein BGW36DRAFT_429030 [Talaromyces proteolyticus]